MLAITNVRVRIGDKAQVKQLQWQRWLHEHNTIATEPSPRPHQG
jgi:hypothetical protein